MRKEEKQGWLEPASLAQLCLKWLKTSRKARKGTDWQSFYKQMLSLLIPDIDLLQLLVPSEIIQEQMQLFLSSLIHTQVEPNYCLVQSLMTNILILLKGTLQTQETKQTIYTPTALIKINCFKNQTIRLNTVTRCDLLRGERKGLQKLKNDILKQDRQIKESFLSKHLFCGLTPVYPQAAVTLISHKEGKQINIESDSLVLLQTGLVLRKPKKKGQGSQLTQGSLLNAYKLANLLNFTDYSKQEQVLHIIENSSFITFQTQEFLRILKLNVGLKQLLQRKLKLIFDQRNVLMLKSQQIQQHFHDRFRKGAQTMRLHYPIEFKTRPKTAGLFRSFRKKHETSEESSSIADFVTFDRYEKMIWSKQRVLEAKIIYKNQVREKTIIPIHNQKKLKQQSKMLKLQTGKIQKMSQRQSKADTSGMRQIKKNLFRVTNLFDEPLDPDLAFNTPLKQKESQTKSSSALRRMSGIKPQEYLKETYLTEFLKKKTNGPSIRELESSSPNFSNKQNLHSFQCFTISQGFGCKKNVQTLNITISHPI